MSNRFVDPRPQFMTSTPTAYVGGHLKFYISGTSAPKNVYSDATLAASIGADLTLNSAGYYAGEIFLAADSAYKVVLEDSLGNVIWTADPVESSNFSTNAQFLTYAGNPNGNVAGTAGTDTIQSDVLWDRTNNILYVATTTGDASTTVWTAVNASSTTPAVPVPQGRLTLTSAEPVLTTGVGAGTSVFYALYNGNLVPVYNGTTMIPTEFTELTLTLASQHALSTIYDVFVFSNSGVLTLVTGPAWSVSTAGSGARGSGAGTTALVRVKGLWVNSVQITGRNGSTTHTIAANRATYLGSIFIDGTAGQITANLAWGSSRKFGVWNAYNRVDISLRGGDVTASWTYDTNTRRASNNDATNVVTVFAGLPEEIFDITFEQNVDCGSAAATTNVNETGNIAVGVNSTTVASGRIARIRTNGSTSAGGNLGLATGECLVARHLITPVIGIQNIQATEIVTADTANHNITFYGTEDNMMLLAKWKG